MNLREIDMATSNSNATSDDILRIVFRDGVPVASLDKGMVVTPSNPKDANLAVVNSVLLRGADDPEELNEAAAG